jgi:hypothetical protein
MNRILAAVVVLGSFFSGRVSATEAPLDPGPVLRGTINVIAANEQGIVVLTDSMLSYKVNNGHGGWAPRQVPGSYQKLFQIDDHTVCAFAGFASANTPAVPDFLNNASAIMGRYEGSLRRSGSITIAEKLELLDIVFSYYLRGVANMLELPGSNSDYVVEFLVAGYDPDGTSKVGSLILNMQPETAMSGGSFLDTVTLERKVIPVAGKGSAVMQGMIPLAGGGFIVVHGQPMLAMEILQQPVGWVSDPAVAVYADSRTQGKPLTVEQMKALAISLKKRTSEREPTVGGPNQIAVLRDGHIQSIDQPKFSPITATGFKFRIVANMGFENSRMPAAPMGEALVVSPDLFTLSFKNSFKRVQQHLDGAYFGGNVFRECRLLYNGGRLQFEDSNEVYDSDLILSGVNRDTPEVKHLLNDFKWRHVYGPGETPKSPSTEDRPNAKGSKP